MTETSIVPVKPTLIERIDALLARRIEHLKVIRVAVSRRDMAIKAAKEAYAKEVGTHETDLEEAERELGGLMRRFHYLVTRRYTKTIARDQGTVFEVLQAPEVEWPGSEEGLIRTLRSSKEGRQFVKVTYTVDKAGLKDALKKRRISSGLMRRLRRRGLWLGQHRDFFVQSNLEDNRKRIQRTRFVEPKPVIVIQESTPTK